MKRKIIEGKYDLLQTNLIWFDTIMRFVDVEVYQETDGYILKAKLRRVDDVRSFEDVDSDLNLQRQKAVIDQKSVGVLVNKKINE